MFCFHMNTVEEFFQLTQPFMLTHVFYEAHKNAFPNPPPPPQVPLHSHGKNKPPQPPQPLPPPPPCNPVFISKNKDDPLFWCLYVSKYGMKDNHEKAFTTITNYTNQMIKEKEEIIEHVQQNMANVKLCFKKQKMTIQQLNEIMADVLSNMKTSIEMSFIWAYYYELSICFVNFQKKFYVILDGQRNQETPTLEPTPTTVISFIKTKENFYYTLHIHTQEIWKEVKEKCVMLKGLYKLPPVSSFKVPELISLAEKWGLDGMKNLKKTEIYGQLQKYLCQDC